MSRHFDKDGQVISFEQWAAYFEDVHYRSVALDLVGYAEVSTIWNGTPSAAETIFQQRPTLFETAVRGMPDFNVVARWYTLAEALEGHAEIVRRVRTHVSS